MAYLISEESQELVDAVRDFCENEVKEQSKEYDRTGEWPAEIYEKVQQSPFTKENQCRIMYR